MMPDRLDKLMEEGLLATIGFMFTASLAFLGIHIKGQREFRNQVYKKIDRNDIRINEKLDDHKEQVSQSHPTNNEFKMLLDMVKSIDTYIKEEQ